LGSDVGVRSWGQIPKVSDPLARWGQSQLTLTPLTLTPLTLTPLTLTLAERDS